MARELVQMVEAGAPLSLIRRRIIEDRQATLEANAGWVETEKQMPEPGKPVLVRFETGAMTVGHAIPWRTPYFAKRGGRPFKLFPTHWRPLPEPPKDINSG